MTFAYPASHKGVVIVGAGPAGLTAACELLRRNVPVRLLDRRPEASGHSKALLLWPRTLEVFAQLGLAEEAAQRSIPIAMFSYHSSRSRVARIRFGEGTTPLCLPQRATEEMLTGLLHRLGGKVERGSRVAALSQHYGGVELRTVAPDGTARELAAGWVIGADGAHSTIRDALGIQFQGATYPTTFMLADAFGGERLRRDEAHYFFHAPGQILVVVPLPDGRHRFFVNAPPGEGEPTLGLLQRLVDERGPGGITLHDPEWLSSFQVHHRVATRMRSGRCFLMGDAAHVHSPAGGQGLNTGIQDAHNLAWKLAAFLTGVARPELLDTYHVERRDVARQVVRDTDIQTRAWLMSAPWKVLLRDVALRSADASGALQHYAPVMAGKRIRYPALGAAVGGHGGIGTTFPPGLLSGRDHDPSRYLLVTTGLAMDADGTRVREVLGRWRHLLSPATAITSSVGDARAASAGLGKLPCGKPGYYLVRPDGYIALHGHAEDLERVDEALAAFHDVRPPSRPWLELGVEPLVDEPGVTSWVEHIPAGQTRPMHTHRLSWVTIVLSGGTAEVLGPDGQPRGQVTLTAGEVKFNHVPPGKQVRHALRNTGQADLTLVAMQPRPSGSEL